MWRKKRTTPTDTFMKCQDVRAHLERYLDGRLSAAAVTAFEAHLAGCADCRQLAREEPLWLSSLRQSPPRARLTEQEAAAIRQGLYRSMRWRMIVRNTKTTLQGAAALATLILVVGLIVWWQQQDARVTTLDPQPPIPATDEVVITMAGFPAFQQAYETLAQQFQESYPAINVQYVALDERASSLSLRERAALSDVILLSGRPPADAASFLLDLAPLAETGAPPAADDFWPGLLEACQAGGVQVGLPLSANVDLIFYDKSAFDAEGLPYPEPSWDWLAFRQTAQDLSSSGGVEGSRFGFVDSGRPLSLLGPLVDSLLAANEGSIGAERLATELDWYVNFVQAGVIPAGASDPQTAVANRDSLIRNRQAAMWLGGQFEQNTWQSVFAEDLGIASFPTSSGADNPARPTCAAVSAGSAQPQAAWVWIHFLSTQPAVGTGSDVPARPPVAQSSGYWTDMEEGAAVALLGALERGWYGSSAVSELTAVNNALLQAIAAESSLAGALPATIERQPTAPPPTPDGTPIAVATPVALPDSSIAGDNVIVVDYLYYDGFGHTSRTAVEFLADAFNGAQDGIEVRVGTDFRGSYITDAADNYDCFAWGGTANNYAVSHPDLTNKIYSLDPLANSEDAAFLDDFNAMGLDENRVGGELFGLPVAFSPLLIRYNAELFAELNLDPPSPGWTIDDFWELAAAASRDENGGKIYGFVPAVNPTLFLSRFASETLQLAEPDSWPPAANFTEADTVAALTLLARMVESGVMFPGIAGGSNDTSQQLGAQVQQQQLLIDLGQAAMWISHAGLRSGYHPFATGVAPFPGSAPEPGGPTTTLYISRRAENPLGCWEWLKFLSVQPDAFSGIPVRRSVLDSEGWRAVAADDTVAAYRFILSRLAFPAQEILDRERSLMASPYQLWWVDALQEVHAGADPEIVLEETQRRADAYHACLSGAPSPKAEQATACAQEADPGYQSP